ncbi:MAG TPA: hemerythrin domain-containing protein [Gaiellaceae bacterium]|nr:hemerythrin domain-containing protein [Gaiellaceae bacterium]
MKRHSALVPLSHDHHQTLVRARELRRAAADGDDAELEQVAGRFRRAFAGEVTRHFRDEEELLFPLLGEVEPPPETLVRALTQHARIRSLEQQLPDRRAAAALGTLLEEHVRLEERELFDLIQRTVSDERLASLSLSERNAREPVVDLLAGDGEGPLWGTASDDLNATVLAWPAGAGTPEHVNGERDVLVIGVAGSGTLTVDGETHALGAGTAALVEKGSSRRIEAGAAGIRYLTVHLRRGGLSIAPRGG